jgi:Tuberculosis necrotizing toxin
LSPTDQDALVKQIGLALMRTAPDDWQQISAEFRATGRYYELSAEVTGSDGNSQPWTASHDIAMHFAKLRAGMYRDGRGTWFNARYQIEKPSSYNLEFDRLEPQWRTPPPTPAFRDELHFFPRTEDNVPEWLMRKLSGLPPERPGRRFRLARIFDGTGPGGRPTVNRPPVTDEDRERLLDYLDHATLALPERGHDIDRLSPDGQPVVPVAFHTDGAWVWPAAVNYYLRRYGLPPDPELVNHARSNGFRSPEVDEQTRLAAAATITGGRPPGPPRQSGPGPGPNGIAPPVGPGGPPRPGVPAGAPPMPVAAMAAVGDVAAVMSPGGPPPPPLALPPTDEGLGAHGMGGIDEHQDELDDIELDDDHSEHDHELLADRHDHDDVPPADPPVAPPIVLPPTAQPQVAPSIQSRSQQERTINLLRQRLADLGVPESAYRIGEPAPRTWYVEQADGGWQVGWFDGEFSSPMLFEEVSDASAFLLGKLLLGVPAETGAPAGVAPTLPPVADRIEPLDLPAEPPPPPPLPPVEPEAVTEQHAEPVDEHLNDRVPEAPAPPPPPIEWPIQPMAGEPPLTLFRGKRLLELQPGTEVDRFGTPEGNLTYVAGTPFEQRSLVPDWVHRPYHVYRLIRPLQALTGGAIPWFDQPGGGTAYLLPRAVAELIDNGDLVEIGPPEQPSA